jgi:hypothetical protein
VAKVRVTTAHCHNAFMPCNYRGLMSVSVGFVKGCADVMQTVQRWLLVKFFGELFY